MSCFAYYVIMLHTICYAIAMTCLSLFLFRRLLHALMLIRLYAFHYALFHTPSCYVTWLSFRPFSFTADVIAAAITPAYFAISPRLLRFFIDVLLRCFHAFAAISLRDYCRFFAD